MLVPVAHLTIRTPSYTVKPVAVHILTKEKFVSVDKAYDVECKSSGSRPEAVMTWWMGTRQIKRLAKHVRLPRLLVCLHGPLIGMVLAPSAVLRDGQSVAECAHIHPDQGGRRAVVDVSVGESFYCGEQHRRQVAVGGPL